MYYGNVCLSLLPILDVILGRLLENDSVEIISKLVQRFGPLYRYHDAPISFLIRFLHYYYDNDAISSKIWKLNFVDLISYLIFLSPFLLRLANSLLQFFAYNRA